MQLGARDASSEEVSKRCCHGDGTDKLIGLSGDDYLWGNAGNDELTGNGGFDTAYFFGLRSSYSVQTVSGTVRVVDNAPTAYGNDGTDTIAGIELLSFKNGETASVSFPIILDLDGDRVETLSAAQSHARFDLDGDGLADDTSWVGRDDGLLYLDRNGDGTVTGAAEITFIDDLPGATADLAGLRAFDGNGDGKLDATDQRFVDFGCGETPTATARWKRARPARSRLRASLRSGSPEPRSTAATSSAMRRSSPPARSRCSAARHAHLPMRR